jgi:Arc/MetJ-type ribon-helix-helix transcriptional regulator
MRMHINLGDELVKQIDDIAGSRGRSRFIREAVENRLDVEARLAARRRAFGSIPDFAPWMTPEWISRNRKEEGRRRQERLDKHWRREDDGS